MLIFNSALVLTSVLCLLNLIHSYRVITQLLDVHTVITCCVSMLQCCTLAKLTDERTFSCLSYSFKF